MTDDRRLSSILSILIVSLSGHYVIVTVVLQATALLRTLGHVRSNSNFWPVLGRLR